MVAVDTNVLVYAHRQDSPWHGPALEAIRSLAEGDAPWAIPWPCVHEFLSVLTNPRIFGPPTVMPVALQAMEHLMETSGLILIAEGAEHFASCARSWKTATSPDRKFTTPGSRPSAWRTESPSYGRQTATSAAIPA